ncbi:uncharacterized protein (DUF2236 family) [Herbihabitans rhizosphaerae]|uniref:Uncharacterized protein (DUF2236 family) n=1 Tax=Herbihabitans rhizosphaerae TaxID=1872711 RepID=A0A4Q7L6D2_9PSEU|nr:oxygenase MpaB family protein [Herbihabitans rhizosphaerae]RZS44864.1 uncharacterized protein (DUF2236 family) [Herbihabitans rhizosphaerae]
MTAADELPAGEPVPLGPDSLTWKHFGDWRGLLPALWAGSMQNMHPELGAGVEEHSRFFDERWERLFRSLYPIGGVVYDGPRAPETALEVRGYHNTIKGVDSRGRRYSALNPDTYYWAHSTFFVGMLLTVEYFCGGLSEQDKRTMYDEHVRWYRLYRMSMRPVPETWEEFQEYYDRMCREVLEDNKAARDVLDIARLAKPVATPWMPDFVWRMLRRPIARGGVWMTVGLYHPAVREKLGYTWTRRDEMALRLLGKVINAAFTVVPFERRYHPRARAAWRRVRGAEPVDAPLVETPARNLPPVAERDDPKHYSPKV